jgi:hypothetical protein
MFQKAKNFLNTFCRRVENNLIEVERSWNELVDRIETKFNN